jgi:2-dehydro-3-deoxyglucarate aldolase/4-hydroxy-2-oxoheptanedioate aldolase
MSRACFDWLLIDMEHGPGDMMTLVSQLQAISGSDVVPIVRAPWNDFVVVKRILDAGAYGILFPYVNTKTDAQAAVRACKYPPEGIRGVAGSTRAAGYGQNPKDYLTKANDEILVIVAVETPEAISQLGQILEVPGVDGVFIGPMDLSTSMGHPFDPNHPEVQAAIAAIEAQVLAANKFLGTVSLSWEQARSLYQKGYQMVTLMADGVSLGKLATEIIGKFRAEFPEG